MSTPDAPLDTKPAGLGKSLRTVAFGLLGVAGNRRDLAAGTARVSPLRLLVIALIFMAMFVGGLITLATRIAHG